MKTDQIIEASTTLENLVDHLDKEELDKIGALVVEECKMDEQSRAQWEERNDEAFKLALQVMETKSYPWQGASNVKFPLVTMAALQFHARAYPALVPDSQIIRCKVTGKDPEGKKKARAERVSDHMNYQIYEEDEPWEDETDRQLISLPIVGCAFKKSYFDPELQHNVSCNVFAKDLIVPYFTKSLYSSPRITHRLQYYPHEIKDKQGSEFWADVDIGQAKKFTHQLDQSKDERQGVVEDSSDKDRPYEVLEQHRWLDLDDDGVKEPYIVTVNRSNEKVFRIVPRFQSENLKLDRQGKLYGFTPDHYFTKYSFIPSPDGGFYDIGFGVLLAPINASINSIINILIDGGHLATIQGGFLGRGARMAAGQKPFRPGEWRNMNATGDDLKKSIVPLPVKEPSTVLFQLLGLLINYGERTGSATETMTGEMPGQNTPATVYQGTVEQGMKVFNGIFKRLYRSMRQEFRKLYVLNGIYLNEEVYYEVLDDDKAAFQADYLGDAKDIQPAANPNATSQAQKMAQAQALSDRSQIYPGYKKHEVEIFMLEAMEIPDPNTYLMEEEEVETPTDPKIELEMKDLERKAAESDIKLRIQVEKSKREGMMFFAELNKMEAETMNLIAQAEAAEQGPQLEQYRAFLDTIKLGQEEMKLRLGENNGERGISGVETPPGNQMGMGGIQTQ